MLVKFVRLGKHSIMIFFLLSINKSDPWVLHKSKKKKTAKFEGFPWSMINGK